MNKRFLIEMLLVVLVVVFKTDCTSIQAGESHVLLLDHLDETFVPNGKIQTKGGGTPTEGARFVPGKFSNGLLVKGAKLTYPPKGNINLEEGTIEMWVIPKFAPQDSIPNQELFRLKVANSIMCFYYNTFENGIVFYLYNPNHPNPPSSRHSPKYTFLLTTGELNWHEGETHHIAVTWSKKEERIYIDGETSAISHYPGNIVVGHYSSDEALSLFKNASLSFGGGNFVIDEIRILDIARAPTDISKPPSEKINKSNLDAQARHSKISFQKRQEPYIKEEKGEWRLGNRKIECIVSKKTGEITSFVLKEKKVSVLKKPATLNINAQNSTKSLIKKSKIAKGDGNYSLFLEQSFPSIGLDFESRFVVWDDYIEWGVRVSDKLWGNKPISISFNFPCFSEETKLSGFVPMHGSPFLIKGHIRKFRYGRSGGPGEISLPLATVYHRSNDYGLSLVEPFEVDNEILINFNPFAFAHRTFTILNKDLKEKDGKYQSTVFLIPHEGDFRPVLNWVLKKYPEYFGAVSNKSYKLSGIMQCGGSRNEKEVEELTNLGLRWREVNMDSLTGGYGLWIPDDITPKIKKEITKIRKELEVLHQYGVLGLLYCQGIDCSDESFALENFPDCVEKDSDGKPIREPAGRWIFMNPYPGSSWYKHIIEQVNRILDTFPEADGIFWDRARVPRQHELLKEVAKIVHQRGKLIVGNNVMLRVRKFVDGFMAESTRENVQTMQYLALATPNAYYLPVYYDELTRSTGNEIKAAGRPKNAERDLKTCLKCGIFLGYQYSLPYHDQSLEILQKYLPLMEYLKGRKWVLNAHALTLPNYLEGNIFQRNNGDYIVYLISPEKSYFDETPFYHHVPVKIKVKEASKIKKVFLRSVDYEGQMELDFSRSGEEISIIVPRHKSTSMLLFQG